MSPIARSILVVVLVVLVLALVVVLVLAVVLVILVLAVILILAVLAVFRLICAVVVLIVVIHFFPHILPPARLLSGAAFSCCSLFIGYESSMGYQRKIYA